LTFSGFLYLLCFQDLFLGVLIVAEFERSAEIGLSVKDERGAEEREDGLK